MSKSNVFLNIKTKSKMAKQSIHELSDSFVVLNKDGKKANTSLKGLTNSLGGMSGVIKGIGLYKLTQGLTSAMQSAMDTRESIHMYNVAMGEFAESTAVAVDKLSELTGLDRVKMLDTVGEYNLLARSMGMTSKNASVLSENTNRLALDLGALTNRDFTKVAEDLRSGLIGQSKTMYKYGIDVTEAAIAQEALNQGISKSVRHMSQGEKMALRYAVMIKSTSLYHGDFAETINQPANQLRILGDRFITLTRTIGNLFIPMLQTVLPWLNAILQVITKLIDRMAVLFGGKKMGQQDNEKVENTFGDMGAVEDGMAGIGDEADGATKKADKLKKKLQQLAGFDELNILGKKETPKEKDIGGADDEFGIGDMDLGGYDSMIDGIAQKSDELVDKLVGYFNKLKQIGNVIYEDWGIKNLMDGIQGGFDLINFDKIKQNFESSFKGLKSIAGVALRALQPVFQSAGKAFGTYMKYGIGIVGNIFEPISTGFANFITNASPDISRWIMDTADKFTNGFGNLDTIWEIVGNAWLNSVIKYKPQIEKNVEDTYTVISDAGMLVGTVVADVFEGMTEGILIFVEENQDEIRQFTDGVVEMFTDSWELVNTVWEGMLEILTELWDEFGVDMIDSIAGFFADIGEWFLEAWNEFVKPVWDDLLEWLETLWEDTWKDMFKEIGRFLGLIGEAVAKIWKLLKPVLDYILKKFLPKLKSMFDTIMDLVGIAFKFIGTEVKAVMKILNGLLDFILGVFSGDWGRAWEGVKNIFGGIWDGLKALFVLPINFIIVGLNTFLRQLNRIKIPDWVPGIGGLGFDIPEIELLARGGMPNTGSLFMAGEAGAELIGSHKGQTTVMPLEESGFVQAMSGAVYGAVVKANSQSQGSGGSDGGIVVNVGGRTLVNTIVDGINRQSRIDGKTVITV